MLQLLLRHRLQPVALTACLCLGIVAAPVAGNAQTIAAEPAHRPVATPEAPRVSAPFKALFGDAVGDFRRLISTESATILAIGGAAAAIAHGSDRPISDAMAGAAPLRSAFGAGETLGGARVQAAGAVATLTLGLITSNETVTAVGADLVRAQLVTQVLTAAVKTAVGRTRPDGTQYSFPSGHSAVTFASATVLQRHFGWKAGVPAYALAAYVAASRVQVKRHFLSDVAFGAALGVIAGRTVTIGRGNRRFALAPTVVPGGGGIGLTWLAAH